MNKVDLVAYRALLERAWPLTERWNTRSFHSSPIAREDIKIEVPNMGDSISEGTIAGIERKAGTFIQTFSKSSMT